MFQEIPVNEKKVFAFKAVGRLTHDDYQSFLPKLEQLLADEGRISILLELENFHGWDMEAAMDDYRFGMAHQESFERIAIIGDKRWEKWMAFLTKPFVEAKVRFFEHEDIGKAWDWLREPYLTKQEESALPEWKHILVPTDFSPNADRALRRALQIAQRHNAKLTLLHAVEDLILYDEFYDPIVPSDLEFEETMLNAAGERMGALVKKLDIPSPHIEILLGSPKATILNYIEAQQVDLVVMGSHGRRGLGRLLGSTTNGVLNSARCEVLSVPLTDLEKDSS